MDVKHVWVLVAAVFLAWGGLGYAEEAPKPGDGGKKAEGKKEGGKKAEKKGEPERLWLRGPRIDELKTELGLTDDQVAKLKEALAPVEKKSAELECKADVKAAEEAVEKAKEALKAAEEKSKAARDNFDLLTERKKAAYSAIPEDKKAKAQELLHYAPDKEKGARKKEKKAEEGGDKK